MQKVFFEKTNDSARAIHLERLVKPKWSQVPQAYKLMSSLSPRE
jgi:hypothetical protein